MNLKLDVVNKIQSWIITLVIFLFPFVFVPFIRDFVIYSKFYFLFAGVVILLLISFFKLVLVRKFEWVYNPALQAVILMILANFLSTIIMSPNKLGAIFDPHYGLVSLVSFVVLFIYTSHSFQKSTINPILLVSLSGLLLSILSLLFLIEPLKNVAIPPYWSFLKSSKFNPIGTNLDLIAFLIFASVGSLTYLWRIRGSEKTNNFQQIVPLLSLVIVFITLAIVFNIYTIIQAVTVGGSQFIFPPISLSWYSAVDVLKHPLTAIFGFGVNNFSRIFTQVRDVAFNNSALWQVNSFNNSFSAILHIFTEQGLLGLSGFIIFTGLIFKQLKKVKVEAKALFLTSLVFLAILPPSIIIFFMFFISSAIVISEIKQTDHHEIYEVDLTKLLPVYIGTIVVSAVLVAFPIFWMGKVFTSDVLYKKSVDGLAENNIQKLYDNQRLAIQYNNSNEDFHKSFAQANLAVVNNVMAKGEKNLTDTDRQTLSQAIQIAIAESKNAIALNPQKASNWQNLASVYRYVINIVQEAPQWTVSSYQQAIQLDPQNPVLRLDLGGVFYLFQNYEEAQKMFEQAVFLKNDWTNARYNLAWSYYQRKMYQPAFDQMQILVSLLNPAKQSEDFKKAQKELATFKKTLDEETAKLQEQQQATQQESESQLNLPTPPAQKMEPKIELPKDASPEANSGQDSKMENQATPTISQ